MLKNLRFWTLRDVLRITEHAQNAKIMLSTSKDLHSTHDITPKRVTNDGVHLRGLALKNHSSGGDTVSD